MFYAPLVDAEEPARDLSLLVRVNLSSGTVEAGLVDLNHTMPRLPGQLQGPRWLPVAVARFLGVPGDRVWVMAATRRRGLVYAVLGVEEWLQHPRYRVVHTLLAAADPGSRRLLDARLLGEDCTAAAFSGDVAVLGLDDGGLAAYRLEKPLLPPRATLLLSRLAAVAPLRAFAATAWLLAAAGAALRGGER